MVIRLRKWMVSQTIRVRWATIWNTECVGSCCRTCNVSNATWNNNKNIFTNVGSHILLWPDNETSGGYWILTSEDTSPMVDGKTAFKYVLDSIWENYKKRIANDLGINVNTLKKDDISQIKLSAYKISRDNSNTDGQFFHIDCMIMTVVSKANLTAKFRVKYPGSEEYKVVDTKNYKHNSKVDNTETLSIRIRRDYC